LENKEKQSLELFIHVFWGNTNNIWLPIQRWNWKQKSLR
jgi:hypothetical protein